MFKSARAGRVLGMEKQLLALMTVGSILLTENQMRKYIPQATHIKILHILIVSTDHCNLVIYHVWS